MYFNNDDNEDEDDDFDFVIENDYGVDDHQSIYVFLYYENVQVLIFSFW